VPLGLRWLLNGQKRHKPPGIFKSQQNCLKQAVEIRKLTIFIWNKEKLTEEWKEVDHFAYL
jgi:hypothetical protein